MEHIQPFCSTQIVFADMPQMRKSLEGLSCSSAVVILSDTSLERWQLSDMISAMQEKMTVVRIGTKLANPTQNDIAEALQAFSFLPDVIVAFGGGSAIDLAKGISAFAGSKERKPEEILRAIRDKTYCGRKYVPIIAVPSTAGTGSELTQWATVWDANKSGKFSIDDPGLKPVQALIVPELTMTLSKNLTLSTGLDALAHAMEAYWSKHTNVLVQDIAYRAIELIIQNLPEVLNRPDNLLLRKAMCRASVLAGLAFSQTRTTACHSMSYPMTMLYGVPHGLAAAMTLAQVAMRNRGHFANDEALFALFAQYGGIQYWLDSTCTDIVSLRLKPFGISAGDIDRIVERSFTGGRMDNNPVDLSQNDVRMILNALL